MQVPIEFDHGRLMLEVPSDRLIGLERPVPQPPLADPAAAVRDALESPLRYPALRLALTPDDHVTVVVDEHLPRVADLLTPILEHVVAAGVEPAAITLLCPPTTSKQPWIEDLPETFQDVHLEVHDPADRTRLAYLATTKAGRRIYLNRAAVDADQLVVLTGRRFDPVNGYAGTEAAIYPALSDGEARAAANGAVRTDAPAHEPWSTLHEAGEVSWLLGAPFYVQVIEGGGDTVLQVFGGSADSSAHGRRLLDQAWRATAGGRADVVIATMTGDPTRQDLAAMARALASAARVVRPDGVIALLTAAAPELTESFRQMARADDADDLFKVLKASPPADWPAAFQWLNTVRKGHVYLLSGLPAETAEGLFTTPIEHARQVQRLIDAGGTCIVLPDAHKLLAVTK
jgi:nickel-dependent lactate racemase